MLVESPEAGACVITLLARTAPANQRKLGGIGRFPDSVLPFSSVIRWAIEDAVTPQCL
jgi:hypothetical protein